jgi:hypothetical protein
MEDLTKQFEALKIEKEAFVVAPTATKYEDGSDAL